MEKYGDLVAFTSLKDIEIWSKEQYSEMERLKSYLNIYDMHTICINIDFIKKGLVSSWKSNPSSCLLVQEDELNCFINLSNKYMLEMIKFAERINISQIISSPSIFNAHQQMNKYSEEDLKKMFLMCNEDIEAMRRLMMFLAYECIDEKTVKENLSNETPVPFIIDDDTDNFLYIPCNVDLKNYSYDCGYRFEISFSKEGQEILGWMEYCQNQRESFEERYKNSFTKKM